MKQSIRRRTPVCPVPKPRRRNVSQTDEASPRSRLTLTEVGVSRLPGQVLRRLLRQSYSLNVLVVGAAGLGKSSLIRTLLRTDRTESESKEGFVSDICDVISSDISVRMRLTEAPGYGDAADNNEVFDQIEKFVTAGLDQCFDVSLSSGCQRDTGQDDEMTDVCIFLLSHTGHGVRNQQISQRFLFKFNIWKIKKYFL